METINIIHMTHYRDGGTLSFKSDNGKEYCRDGRFTSDPNNPGKAIEVPTYGLWFNGYPGDTHSTLINDENIIQQLNNYSKSYKGI
jgi:hypothetical protein